MECLDSMIEDAEILLEETGTLTMLDLGHILSDYDMNSRTNMDIFVDALDKKGITVK